MTERTFPPPGHYHRPTWGLWRWIFVPPAVKAAVLYGVAAAATSTLAGIRIYQALTAPTDETGD